ncbi:MAG: oxygen-independent coproporphyrinogen III oxidase [Caulobacterales bacterium]
MVDAAARHLDCGLCAGASEVIDPTLRPYAELTAPRYTSYPTAPHFHAGIAAPQVRGWLAGLTPDARLGLYLHIPFCKEICWYCGCHTVASRRDAPVEAYADTLAAEIDLIAAATPARRVDFIQWGGGTPNRLPPAAFAEIANRLALRFDLSAVSEHSVECDPRTLSPAHAAALADAGVTRASLGLRDVNPHVQAAIGRVQPYEQVANAMLTLRRHGIERLNLDLMYGLPQQSIADAVRSAEAAADLEPDRLAAFGYAHVPWFKTRQRLIDETTLPGADIRFDQAEAITQTLQARGYVAIGFDHFARPDDAMSAAAARGELGRSFQGYTGEEVDALIGLGASAISTYPDGYAQNAPDLKAYARAIAAGDLAHGRGIALSGEDRVRRAVIERLLCDFAVDLAPLGGLGAFAGAAEPLAALAADGLVETDADTVCVTPRARPFARLAAQAFDAYRAAGAARHSRAV